MWLWKHFFYYKVLLKNIVILTKIVRLRNRYTHDYYKKEGVEEDIFKCCFSEIMYLEIFLEVTDTEVYLKRK